MLPQGKLALRDRMVALVRQRPVKPTNVVRARGVNARNTGFTVSVTNQVASSNMRGRTKPNVIRPNLRPLVGRLLGRARPVGPGVPLETALLVMAVAGQRREALVGLVAPGRDLMGRVVRKVRVGPAARHVLGLQMVRGGLGRGRVRAPRVVPRNIVLRAKLHPVILHVGNRSLSRPVVVGVVRRIVLSILQTAAVCALPSVIRTPVSTEILASSVTALLLRRSVPVVRSPLKEPRARRSDR